MGAAVVPQGASCRRLLHTPHRPSKILVRSPTRQDRESKQRPSPCGLPRSLRRLHSRHASATIKSNSLMPLPATRQAFALMPQVPHTVAITLRQAKLLPAARVCVLFEALCQVMYRGTKHFTVLQSFVGLAFRLLKTLKSLGCLRLWAAVLQRSVHVR